METTTNTQTISTYDLGYGLAKGGIAAAPAALTGFLASTLGLPSEGIGLAVGIVAGSTSLVANAVKFAREQRLFRIQAEIALNGEQSISKSDLRFLFRVDKRGSISQSAHAKKLLKKCGWYDEEVNDGE